MNEQHVALWLYNKIKRDIVVNLADAVQTIEETFGKRFTFAFDNGMKAVNKTVVMEFGKLNKDGKIEWNPAEYKWVFKM
ncbi:hypothetical protein AZ66_14075 [Paenibacillus sp. E194]|uniref:DUF6953 family protein n=1 Tax=Paenibacillus sp. E194 TaxID=1458845 RepID=UPI0005CB795C|nr:hypothetical protein [Paenibacillus sp. E194]KJB87274.1 hypothetical protein AZ66_14075 [Paenibacillus sp. E194]